MFWVEYYCPCPAEAWKGWQRGRTPYPLLGQAQAWAAILKPPGGNARVIDGWGRVVYSV